MTDLLPTTLSALKTADPDRCRAALLADEVGRRDLLTLYAFHYELAKVPDVTSEPMLGEIRYQWWRDAVNEIYAGGPVRQHEVSTPLAELLIRRKVPRFWIDQLIDGRSRDLDPTPFEMMEDARNYCRRTSGVLVRIAMKILDEDELIEPLQIGEAWGLTGLARAYGFYHDRMLSNLAFPDLLEAAEATYHQASAHPVDERVFPAVAYVALVPGFLKCLRKSGFDPLTSKLGYGPVAKQARLMTATLRGRI